MHAPGCTLPALVGDHEYSGHIGPDIMDSSEAAQVDVGSLIDANLRIYPGRIANLVAELS
jgi:hypothetical protein